MVVVLSIVASVSLPWLLGWHNKKYKEPRQAQPEAIFLVVCDPSMNEL
jgi:hypothetical protein